MNEENEMRPQEKTVGGRPALFAALATYLSAYIYVTYMVADDGHMLRFGIFVLLFFALGEYLCRGVKRSAESWVWLGCAAVMSLGCIFGGNTVWDSEVIELFVHAAAVWWLLCRSGALIEGESGRLLPLDAVNGAVVIPFRNFFLRIATVFNGFKDLYRGGRKKGAVIGTIAAVVIAVCLLIWATQSLAEADRGFRRLLSGVLRHLEFRFSDDFKKFVFRFMLSLPVGAYLFGLICGCAREDKSRLHAISGKTDRALARLRLVPNAVWTAVLAIFCLVYIAFIALQGSYLFGAFAHRLPEGFIVSQYARRGFFELCRVMAINFALLWLALRSGAKDARGAGKLLCTLLLCLSMLFAVVAFSKLALYISCFGFTPKRIESSWLVLVLFAGCVAAGLRLWTGKKTMKLWMIFSAATLALTCLF